jgi:hypothetical protein
MSVRSQWMDEFMRKHGEVIEGVLSCFDRMLFRGYLPIMSGAAMAEFLQAKGVDRWGLKTFLLTQAARLKKHAMEMAAAAGRPYQYLGERTRKEDLARQIAERDGIGDGLVCVFALLELSRTFSVVWKERNSYVQSTRRKCLQLYYYFMDRELGLIHVKLQTWFPFQMQVYLNGHEWLARTLDRRGVKYLKVDNAFAGLSDVARAQQISDQFPSVDWVRVLGRYAKRINPLLGELLRPMEYYWVTAQAEYSTDILFRTRKDLQDLMPRLLEYSTLYFGAKEVMSFLGRKLVGQYRGEVVTDHGENKLAGKRVPGCRATPVTLSPASTIRPPPSASSTPSLAPPPLQTAGRRGPSIRSPAKTARSSRSCSLASTPCTASPIATSDQSSDGLHSLSPKSRKSSPARSPACCAGCTPTG